MPTPAYKTSETTVKLFHETARGRILLGDSLGMFREEIELGAVDLIMTSPPFGLVRKKDYGNADADDYLEWFRPFSDCFGTDNGAAIPSNRAEASWSWN